MDLKPYTFLLALTIGWNSLASARISVAALKEVIPIEWLHIQKTGSTFGNILLRWACDADEENVVVPGGGFKIPRHCAHMFRYRKGTRKSWPIGDHFPLPLNASLSYIRHVVTLLRSPKSQMVSHFYHRRGKGDICKFIEKKIGFGYQTRCITGESVHSQLSCDSACFRISQFAFFGITDFWEASICLFHKEIGGVDLPLDSQLFRFGKYNHTDHSLADMECTNTADECLFQCALNNFLSRLSRTACVYHLYDRDLGSEAANTKLKEMLNFVNSPS